jgi:hypothetical protein
MEAQKCVNRLAEFQRGVQNVDSALTRFCTSYTQVFLSDFKHLITFSNFGCGSTPCVLFANLSEIHSVS